MQDAADDGFNASGAGFLAWCQRNVIPIRRKNLIHEIWILVGECPIEGFHSLALSAKAPGVTLNVQAFNDRDHAVDLLDSGAIDAAIGVPPTHADSRILTRPLLQDEFVTILASDHPEALRGMSIENYLALPHVLVSPEGELYGVVDQVLAQQGKKRKLGLTLPQMFAVPTIVAQTRMTATVMKRVAHHSLVGNQLALFPPPVTLPEVVFDLIWHRRSDANPAQRWFREFIAERAATL
ncbi:LysR substrate-binding domain-containing protein [Pectobacterium cacticida]|uniref:LysR substrate-binding domain-containing protein n=1 Tax=Pectobacterium cacticida TaxID=69221 RepID=UPI0039869C96